MRLARTILSVHDPALDLIAMGGAIGEWAKSRDPGLVRLLDGRQPVVFHIEPCDTKTFYGYVRGGPREDDEHRRAFEVCVKQIDNLGEGRPSSVRPTDEVHATVGKITRWGERELAALFPQLSPSHIEDIGRVCWHSVFFCHLGSAALSPLARVSRDAVTDRISQRADEIRRRLTTVNTGPTSPPAPSPSVPAAATAGSADAPATPDAGKQSRSSKRDAKRSRR